MRILLALLMLCSLANAGDPPAEGEADGSVLRIYDVRDLIKTETDAEAYEAAIAKAGASSIALELSKERAVLIVKATPEVHEAILGLLAASRQKARKALRRLVTIETRIVRSLKPLTPDDQRGRVQFLNAEQTKQLLRDVETREDTELLSAPRITCFDRKRAEVTILNQISYVADVEVKTTKNGATAADPIIETARDGLTIRYKPIVSADGELVTLLIETTLSTVQRPIPTVRIELEGGAVAEIQTPAITRTTWTRAATLPPGVQALLDLGPAPDGEAGARLAVLVRVAAILRESFLGEMDVRPGEEIDLVPEERKKK